MINARDGEVNNYCWLVITIIIIFIINNTIIIIIIIIVNIIISTTIIINIINIIIRDVPKYRYRYRPICLVSVSVENGPIPADTFMVKYVRNSNSMTNKPI